MAKRVAFYVRVSTDGQTVENQLGELHAVASRHGWQVTKIYADRGISGTKGREGRPEFDKLLKAITRREIDMVAAWSVDRLGRSLRRIPEIGCPSTQAKGSR
jgi:DNA invertase Pin-like site-specific DNA recombinase